MFKVIEGGNADPEFELRSVRLHGADSPSYAEALWSRLSPIKKRLSECLLLEFMRKPHSRPNWTPADAAQCSS